MERYAANSPNCSAKITERLSLPISDPEVSSRKESRSVAMVKLLNFVCCFTPIAINPNINGSIYGSGSVYDGATVSPRDKDMGKPSKTIIDGESIILGFLW